MKKREDMTLNELMTYYLEKSQVANGGRTTAAPGSQTTVFVETVGGSGYTEQVKGGKPRYVQNWTWYEELLQ